MKKILVLGAGLSTSSLIKYLLDNSTENNWIIRVGDFSIDAAKARVKKHKNSEAFVFDVNNEKQRDEEISNADIVISMLPAKFHHLVANDCVRLTKNMVTASYVSKEVKLLDEEAKQKGIILLNEIGVDPGIDHMSAMQVINKIRENGGKITEFESNTGGLVAPKYDNNPWNYKFTWNPRNVVLAGQGTSQFLHNKRYKYIPYNKLFTRVDRVKVLDLGEFEAYANRDSLKYRKSYGLNDVDTMFRGTLRRPGYSRAWNIFVQLGLTDDTYEIEDSENMTYRQFINSFLPYREDQKVEEKVTEYLKIVADSQEMYKLRWLGIFEDEKIGLVSATPAQILQNLLIKKWKFDEDDKDMIVMQHQFTYKKNNETKKILSSMVVYGEDKENTAMAITVGIPLAIAVKHILNGKIKVKGVQIPIIKEIYEPILEELKQYKINFIEEEVKPDIITI